MKEKLKSLFGIIFIIIYVFLLDEIGAPLLAELVNFFIKNITFNTIITEIFNEYLLYTIPATLIFISLMLLKKNRYMFSKFNLKNNKILVGLLMGFLMNSVCVLVAYLHKDIVLNFNQFNLLLFMFSFISIAIQSASEEIICRLFLYEKLHTKIKKPIIVILITSAFFSLIHLENDGITVLSLISIFGMGLVTSLMVYYSGNIWGAIAVHTSWNFTQNIIFGLPNSGMPAIYSIFTSADSKNSFAYNSVFGVESSYIALLVIIITILIIYLMNKKNKQLIENKF